MLPPSGKASALNAAVERARHPILVFADARQRFASDAVSRLVRHFRNPQIGAVSGELMLDGSGSTIGDGVGAYWNYEMWLKRLETQVGSSVGGDGAIYAIRAHLWQTLPEDAINDFLNPLQIVRAGWRGVYGERSFRALPAALRDRYFTREAGGWRIDPAIHGMVRWTRANIVDADDVAPLAAAADVVFCRNVLIYFADETVAHVARLLAAGMPDDAHLCLGASESLTRVSSAFELVEVGGAFMYTKSPGQNGVPPREAAARVVGYPSSNR